ncbi:MAG: hypothetical protein KBS94_04940 [Prevotella sp.]|nr:hypothetical protein [Candidatus Equicola faecalis]
MKKDKLFLILACFYAVYLTSPLVADLTHIPIHVVSIITALFCIAMYPNQLFATKAIRWFFIYFVVLGFYVLIGKKLALGIGTVSDPKQLVIESAFILPSLYIISILQYLGDVKYLKTIALTAIISLIVSFVYVLPTLYVSTDLLRDNFFDSSIYHGRIGLPSYTLMHTYVLLMPAMLFTKHLFTRWKKVLWWCVILLFSYIIIRCYITTCIIMLFLSFIAMASYHQNPQKRWARFICIGLLLIIVSSTSIMGGIFHFSENFFQGTAVETKVYDFENLFYKGDASGGSISGRQGLHTKSINSFFQNPIFGVSSEKGQYYSDASQALYDADVKVGGHSSIMDRLGGMGLFGGLPFIMIIFSVFDIWKKWVLDEKTRFYYIITFLLTLLLLYQKSAFGQEGWFFWGVISPCIILSCNSYIKQKQ